MIRLGDDVYVRAQYGQPGRYLGRCVEYSGEEGCFLELQSERKRWNRRTDEQGWGVFTVARPLT